jgi:hypothetical protein
VVLFKENHMQSTEAATLDRKSGEAEGSAVPHPNNQLWLEAAPSPLSSRPERTRISCHAALDKATCAPFRKEGRMKYNNAIKFHRKSGVAQWRDLQFNAPLLEMFSDSFTHSED